MNGDISAAIGFLFLVFLLLIVMLAFKILFGFKRRRRARARRVPPPPPPPEFKNAEEPVQFDPKMQMKERKLVKLPTLIPKKVKVVVVYPERQLETFGKISRDGNEIKTKIGSFIIPPDYKPRFTWSGRKCFLTYHFDGEGNALEIKQDGNVKAVAPNPQFSHALIDRGLMAKIFRFGFEWSSMLTGVFLGTFLMGFMVFIVLPMVGIPVHLGKTSVEIIQQTQTTIPGPGNYTLPFP